MKDDFIKNIADAIERDSNKVHISDKFREYEEWDSLAVLSIMAMINEEFDVTIPRSDFEKLNTIGDIYNYIVKQRRE